MSRWMKTVPLTLALVALSIFTASCNSSGSTQVRFVNAIQDTAQYGAVLDFEFNGTKSFSDIAFLGYLPISGYTSVPAGSDSIEGIESGTTTQVFRADVTLNPGSQSQYTLVATGFATNASEVSIISATDNNTVPATGKVEFRVINASPSGPAGDGSAVDIYIVPIGSSGSIAPPATITNLAYRSVSSYVTLPYNSNVVDGANYTMFVTVTGTTAPIFLTQSLSAGSSSEGSIRTLVLTDQQNIDLLNPLAIVLNDFN
jgi:hypothetical protein